MWFVLSAHHTFLNSAFNLSLRQVLAGPFMKSLTSLLQ
jgi:hypothetical protein